MKQTLQTILLPSLSSIDEEWTSDDWETPWFLGWRMLQILELYSRDAFTGGGNVHPKVPGFVIEPGAGNGNISQFYKGDLPYYCVESKGCRFDQGKKVFTAGEWQNVDFLDLDLTELAGGRHYSAIANLPFSLAMDMLEHFASHSPLPRLLVMLLPTDFFQSKKRFLRLSDMPFRIQAIHQLAGRVPFIRNGTPEPKHKCNDSIFILSPVYLSPQAGSPIVVESPEDLQRNFLQTFSPATQ